MKYKELIDSLTTLLSSHKMIKEVVYAPDWKVNEQAKPGRKYFLAVISPVSSTPIEDLINRAIRITVMDVMPEKSDNRLQIQSDCEGILMDVVKYIKYNTQSYEVVPDPVINIFEAQWADYCAGAILDIVFETEAEDSCDLPFN